MIVAALLKARPILSEDLAVVCRSDCADLGAFLSFRYPELLRESLARGLQDRALRSDYTARIRALAQADVLYYDIFWISVRAYCPASRCMWQEKGRISHSQDSNKRCCIARCRRKTVVRLKGRPSIFGRAGEELDYLRRRWIAVEIVRSHIAPQLRLRAFSLTQRRISRSVTFLSGHSLDDVPHSPDKKTFCVLHAASKLEEVAHNLIREGSSETPIVLVQCRSME